MDERLAAIALQLEMQQMLSMEHGTSYHHLSEAVADVAATEGARSHEVEVLRQINAEANRAKHAGFGRCERTDLPDYKKLEALLGRVPEEDVYPTIPESVNVNWCMNCCWFEYYSASYEIEPGYDLKNEEAWLSFCATANFWGARVSSLKSRVSGLRSQVSGLRSQVSGFKSQVLGRLQGPNC